MKMNIRHANSDIPRIARRRRHVGLQVVAIVGADSWFLATEDN